MKLLTDWRAHLPAARGWSALSGLPKTLGRGPTARPLPGPPRAAPTAQSRRALRSTANAGKAETTPKPRPREAGGDSRPESGGIEHALAQKRRRAPQNSDEAQSLPAMFRASRTQNHPAQEEPETCPPAWDETADVTSTLALERPEQTPQWLLLNSSNKAPTSTGDP